MDYLVLEKSGKTCFPVCYLCLNFPEVSDLKAMFVRKTGLKTVRCLLWYIFVIIMISRKPNKKQSIERSKKH